uniref:Uncharacterized protein n=1 Tax=Moniliophthora roreri TaxID=221103 RepID=A0A0W0GCJ1_MONRR
MLPESNRRRPFLLLNFEPGWRCSQCYSFTYSHLFASGPVSGTNQSSQFVTLPNFSLLSNRTDADPHPCGSRVNIGTESHEIRRCRTEDAKVICMKMVLGVLQTDVLVQLGAGPGGYLTTLSVVDPGRLANGDLGEVERVASAFFVGNSKKFQCFNEEIQIYHLFFTIIASSSCCHRVGYERSSSTISASNKPRCIHEVSSPSEEYETGQFRHRHPDPHYSSRDTSAESILAPVSLPPVRESGYIEEVDEDEEIRSFERSQDSIMIPFLTTHDSEGRFSVPEGASHVRTVELLKERAQLLYRIAKLQQQNYQFG